MKQNTIFDRQNVAGKGKLYLMRLWKNIKLKTGNNCFGLLPSLFWITTFLLNSMKE